MKKIVKLLSMIVALTLMFVQEIPGTDINWGMVSQAADYSNNGCVQWVKDRASQIGITLPSSTGTNEYGLFGASAYWTTLSSYPHGSEPAPNSLAVWKFNNGSDGAGGKYGHVAYVESVNGDNVTVTEGGCKGYSYAGNTGVICRTQSKSKMATLGNCSGFYGYIYLTGQPSNDPNYGLLRKPVGTPLDLGDTFDTMLTDALGKSICCREDGRLQMGTYTYAERSKYIWTFEKQSDGSYKVTSWSGNSMDCAGAGTENGTVIQTYPWNGTDAQKYFIYDAGNGKIVLEPACARGSVIDQGGANGCIHLWEYTANNVNQMFSLQIGAKAKLDSSFDAKIMVYNTDNKKTALYEDSNGDVVHKNWEELNLADKWRYIWHFEKNSDGSYAITNMNDQKGLDCNNWGNKNGTNISTVGYYGSSAQKWNIYDVSEGRYVLEPQCSPGRVADVGGTNGSLHLWQYCNNNGNQRFLLVIDDSANQQVEGPDNLALEYGLSKSLNGLCTYGGKTDNIIYESLNKDIITIEDGWIKALKPGKGIIRATYKNDNTKYKDILCSVRALYFYEQYGQGLLTMDCKDARIVEYEVVATENDEGNVLTVTTSVNNDGEIINKTIDYVIEPAKQNKFFVLVDRKDFANANNDYTTSAELKDKNGKVIEKHSTTYNFDNFSDTYYAQLNVGDTIDVYDSVGYAEKEITKMVIKSDISEGKVTVDNSATKVTGNKGGRIYGAFINLSTAKRTMFIVDVLDDGTEKKDNGNQEAGGDNKNENNTPPSAGNTPSGDNKQDNTLPSDNNKPSKDNSTNVGTNTTTANKQNTVKRPKAQVAKISGVTVRTSTDGTAKVIKLPSGKKKITIPTVVKIDDVKYMIVSVGKKAFKGMKKNAVISINTKQPINIEKNAFKGINSKKVVIKVNKKMKNSNLKRFKKILKKAGFKGKVKKVLK